MDSRSGLSCDGSMFGEYSTESTPGVEDPSVATNIEKVMNYINNGSVERLVRNRDTVPECVRHTNNNTTKWKEKYHDTMTPREHFTIKQ